MEAIGLNITAPLLYSTLPFLLGYPFRPVPCRFGVDFVFSEIELFIDALYRRVYNVGFRRFTEAIIMGSARRGFTLIELLIVIGIIVLLVSILLPMAVRARNCAAAVVCESNLRQWGLATQMYASQNGGCLPRRGQGVGPTFRIDRPADWFNALPPMMKMKSYVDLADDDQIARPGSKSIWICPRAGDFNGPYYWSYGMNMGLSVWEVDQNNGNPDKITGVGNTSILVLFADAPGNYCSVFPSKAGSGYNPVARHPNNTINICFLDSHVEAVAGSYIGCGTGLIEHPDIHWHPPGNTWDSAR